MIVSADLTYFRQHESLHIDFVEGLNLIRGRNEGGKSTIIEAVLYAVQGAKALREQLSEVVTWGHEERELKVKAVLRFEGVDYVFTRSKAGAEVNWHDGKIVGQKEVTQFGSKLLGADPKMAALLMLASQDGLRGALSEGPTAVSGVISKLADYATIDLILDRATQRLLTGAEGPHAARLTEAQEAMAAAEAAQVDPAELGAAASAYSKAVLVTVAAREKVEAAEPAFAKIEQALMDASGRQRRRTELREQIGKKTARLTELLAAIAADTKAAAVKADEKRMQQLRTEIDNANYAAQKLQAYAAFQKVAYPESDSWEGSEDTFLAALEQAQGQADAAAKALVRLQGEKRSLQGKLMSEGKCPTCGHAKHDADEVAKHNANVSAEINALDSELAKVAADAQAATSNVSAYLAVQRAARKLDADLRPIASFVTRNYDEYPPRPKWLGEVPQAIDVSASKAELAKLKAIDEAAYTASGRLASNREARKEIEADIATLQEQLTTYGADENLDTLREQFNDASDSLVRLQRAQTDAEEAEKAAHQELMRLESEVKTQYQRLEMAKARVVEIEEDLRKLAKNNTLLKKLKMLKPAVTDQLWNRVLSSVSNYFTTLRGEHSVVTKDADGFKINGKGIDGFSGSTLDVLALAVRVALTKTFIPHVTFIVLDEPAHGCDVTRTANVLGFLASVGFQQTILASHDELSESVADNVVEVGA